MNETDKIAAEALARRFHETYERLAPAFNYDTRKESAKPWEQVPDTNKKLMIAVCAEILDTYVAAAIEKAEIAVRKDQMDLDDAMWSAKLADQSRAAHANEDNCRKCGRPLGWFEPGLCDNCRAARASNAKPLERCSSNPHYEAHFGDEPARTTEK